MSALSGKVAVVTGGSRGIGLAIAGWLAERGASVVVSGRDADRLQAAVKELEAHGAPVLGIAADAAKREDADRLVDATRERFARLDILVNNAGITRDGLLIRMKDDDWDRVMEINLRGAFLMTRAASKAMVRLKAGGRIINIASTAGAMGNAGPSWRTGGFSSTRSRPVSSRPTWPPPCRRKRARRCSLRFRSSASVPPVKWRKW